ncbi:MAG TPA: hypothetical protein VGJ43_14515, partial [Acidimicrobiales bacterium]
IVGSLDPAVVGVAAPLVHDVLAPVGALLVPVVESLGDDVLAPLTGGVVGPLAHALAPVDGAAGLVTVAPVTGPAAIGPIVVAGGPLLQDAGGSGRWMGPGGSATGADAEPGSGSAGGPPFEAVPLAPVGGGGPGGGGGGASRGGSCSSPVVGVVGSGAHMAPLAPGALVREPEARLASLVVAPVRLPG